MRAIYEKIGPSDESSLHCRQFESERFTAPWHFHPEIELTLILCSRGMRYVGDSIEPFAEGDLVLIGSNVPHFWKNDEPGRSKRPPSVSIVIQFMEDFAGKQFWEKPEFTKIARLLRHANRGLKFRGATQRRVSSLMRRVPRMPGAKQFISLLAILNILADSRESTPLSSLGFMPELDLFDAERINKIHSHVYAHISEPIYQPQVAALVHMSPASFSRFFHQKTGHTFTAFVSEVRIGHAARLLTEEKMNITEVCYACGFENLSNFNRRFRQIKKMTPSEFVAHFSAE